MPDPKNPDRNTADDETDREIEGARGRQWNRDEPEDDRQNMSETDEDREAPEGDDVIDDPGADDAVYGRGGKGIVERDSGDAEPEDEERDK